METNFTDELRALLNRYCAEAPSGTPDFILAEMLTGILREFNEAVSRRAEWRGESCQIPAVSEQAMTRQAAFGFDRPEGHGDAQSVEEVKP